MDESDRRSHGLEPALARILGQAAVDLHVGEGFVLMQKECVADLQKEMENILGRGSEGILVRAGYARGRAVVHRLSNRVGPNQDEFLQGLRMFTERTGLFRLGDVGVEEGRATVQVANSFVARGHGRSGRPVCHYVRGFLIAAGELLLRGTDLVCLERACVATGEAECLFEIVDVSDRRGPSESAGPGGG